MNIRFTAAVLLSLTTVFAQTPDPVSYPIVHVSRPGHSILGSKTRLGANSLQSLATAETLPFWAATSGSYTYQMVGTNPMVAQSSPSTTIQTPIIPVIVRFSDGNTFDPTVPGTCTSQAPLALSLSSPLFGSSNYAPGGTAVGDTQFLDAFQRANFWKYTGPSGINPNYHILLTGSAAPPITVTVPAAYGTTAAAPCGRLGRMELNWFDAWLHSTVFPQLATAGILPSHFPVFLLSNVVMFQNTLASCCALGYHSDFNNPNFGGTVQTYAVADFDTSGSFSAATDINTLAHEIAEWLDDPLGSNPTPAWGRTGQVAGCQTTLEVADPLNGTSQNVTMSNAYTYHVPELAFVSWFYKDVPSMGVNGWYSSNGTFTQPATACKFSSTTLSITPATMAAGASGTVTIKVAASGSTGTPTGNVTLTTSDGATVGTYSLTKGTYTGSISFPAGSYSVTANYLGDLSFGGSSSAVVALSVGAPTVSLSPISLTFASTTLGSATAGQVITLTNRGTASLTGIVVSLAGASPADFPRTTTCSATLAVNATCSISVIFQPTATGTRTATISIANNATGAPHSVPLTGTAVGTPAVSLSPVALTFAGTTLGASSAVQVITLANKGTADLTGINITLAGTSPGDFSRTTTCAATLAVNATCSISVTFKPTATGSRTATVSIANNATGAPHSVPLTGTAVGTPAVNLSPVALTFSGTTVGVSSAAQAITLSNKGTAELTGISISLAGAAPGDFSRTTTCAATLAVNASCSISVTFKPTVAGTRTASLSIANSATGSPQSVPLTGAAIAPTSKSAAVLSVTAFVFSSTTVGNSTAPQTVLLSNSGSTALTGIAISVIGSHSTDFPYSTTCTVTLAASATCAVSIAFKPSAAGTRTATLNVLTSLSSKAQTTSISGTGVAGAAPAATLGASSLVFSATTIGTSTAPKTVTLTNSGTAPLSITGITIGGTTPVDYTQTNNCTSSLAIKASCTVSVVFKPTAKGNRAATLNFATNATGSPRPVSLTGLGK